MRLSFWRMPQMSASAAKPMPDRSQAPGFSEDGGTSRWELQRLPLTLWDATSEPREAVSATCGAGQTSLCVCRLKMCVPRLRSALTEFVAATRLLSRALHVTTLVSWSQSLARLNAKGTHSRSFLLVAKLPCPMMSATLPSL